MEISKIFLKELERPKIDKPIFWDYFSKYDNLMFILLRQYLNTEIKPDLQLYLDKYIPNDCGNSRPPIKKLSNDFYNLIEEDNLPNEYYSHTIEDTKIYKSLDSVFTSIEDFKEKVLKPKDFDSKEYAEFFAANIINHLENISISGLTENVLKDFMNDQQNTRIDIKCYFDKSIDKKEIEQKYRELKIYADNYIYDYLAPIRKFNQIWDEICKHKNGGIKP